MKALIPLAWNVGPRIRPVVIALDIVIFVFAILELSESWFHFGLRLLVDEEILQVITLIMRGLAVWHAGRHL
jgi:hypothetical protein